MVKDDQIIYQGYFGYADIVSINKPDTLRVELIPEIDHVFTFQLENEKGRSLEFFNEVFENKIYTKRKNGVAKGT